MENPTGNTCVKTNADRHDATRSYDERYGDMLLTFAEAAGELTRTGDVRGITFLIECADAILGRALLLLEAQQNKARDN